MKDELKKSFKSFGKLVLSLFTLAKPWRITLQRNSRVGCLSRTV